MVIESIQCNVKNVFLVNIDLNTRYDMSISAMVQLQRKSINLIHKSINLHKIASQGRVSLGRVGTCEFVLLILARGVAHYCICVRSLRKILSRELLAVECVPS